jgi:2-oxo-3-hexenedioate decarboxylase
LDAAYGVLASIATRRRDDGWQCVGRKIGFTNRTIWSRYGVDRPMWAHMWDRTVVDAGADDVTVSLKPFVQPRIEPEVVFKLRGPVPESDDESRILESVEWMAAGFEIVHCHYPGWRFTLADSTADFGLHGALVIGSRVEVTEANRAHLASRLATFEATLSCGDRVIDHGVGANVLDSPALALAHLTRVVNEQSPQTPLAAGEIITTGTITDAWPIQPGETWTSDYGELGLKGLTLTLC